ncbi:MAG TPA: hypothetical protein VFH48_11370 [Chloroflexota bacterium]|nr:hypothetical protein [Chloroflexota bacterium]
MAGFWEIWDLPSRNVLADAESEVEALAIVREFVGEGATYSDLLLLFDDPDVDVEKLPSPVTGEELAQRAASSGSTTNHPLVVPERDEAEQGFRLFYRIVKTDPPTLVDFRSGKAKGTPEPDSPILRAVFDGISVFSTLSQARRKRRKSPALGQYVAVLRVPTDGSVRFQRTFREDGHYTIWADEVLLRSFVVSVIQL